jgi:hypothetical protein
VRLTILISLFFTLGVNAQTLLVVTNTRSDVANEPWFTLSGPVGSYRMTYTVEEPAGTPIDISDNSTFRLEVWASDNFRLYNLTNTLNPEVDASLGQVRFVIPSLGAGQYRVRGIVTPVSGDTNESWNLTHHYLTVTSTPSQAQTINVTNIISVGDTSVTNIFGDNYFTNTFELGVTVTNQVFLTNEFTVGNITVGETTVTNFVFVTNNVEITGVTINVTNITMTTGGIVSNVTESTSNSWDAGTGSLTINTNPPATGSTDTSGIHAPYTNAPASPVTISAANGWWQSLWATGTTSILIADKPVTNNGASVRLDFWTLHSTTITNIEGYASLSISTSAVNVLLFDNPSDRGVTNWYVEQLYP